MTSGHSLLASVVIQRVFIMSITVDRSKTTSRYEHTSNKLQLVESLQCGPISTTETKFVDREMFTNSSACLIVAGDDDVFLLHGQW